MIFEKQALGTILKIETFQDVSEDRIKLCFDAVFQFEQKYSRFIKGNYLSKLNETGQSIIDDEMKTLINVAKKVHTQTSGEFDITLLPILENMGYGIEEKKILEHTGMQHIQIEGNRITLAHQVKIDLGGIGKGFLIDKIYGYLDNHCESFVINFGGDIKVKGKKKVGLEDPYDAKKVIGEIEIENISLCASSGEKRKFRNSHHLISGKTQKNQTDKIAIYTTHKLAILADVYATALYVCPLEKSIELLEKISGLEAMIIAKNGEIYKSKGFGVILY